LKRKESDKIGKRIASKVLLSLINKGYKVGAAMSGSTPTPKPDETELENNQ
jgi:hypothetical protein